MKTEVIFGVFLIILQVVTSEEAKSFIPMEKTCIKQRSLNRDEIESVINEALTYLPEDNPEFNDFLGCYWKKKGYQNENGTINYDSLIELIKGFSKERFGGSRDSGSLGLQLAKKTVDECKNITPGSSRGQTAAKVQNCITRHIEGYVRKEKQL